MQNETQVQIPDSLMSTDNAPAVNGQILEVEMTADAPVEDPISADAVALHDLEQEQTDDEFQRVQDAGAALESYIELVRQAGRDGISRQAAAILNVGLKHTYAQLGLGQVTTGLEDYVTCSTLDARRSTVVSLEELEEKKKGILARLWELIKKGLAAIGDFFKNLTSKASKVKEKAEDAKAKNKKSNVVEGTEFKINDIQASRVWNSLDDGSYLNVDSKAEIAAVEFANKDFPKAVYETFEMYSNYTLTKDNSPVQKLLANFNTVTLSDGLEIVTQKGDWGWWEVGSATPTDPSLTYTLKTRSPHEVDKCIGIIVKLLDVVIDKSAEGWREIDQKIQNHLNKFENADIKDKSHYITEAIKGVQKHVNNPLFRHINKNVLNIVNTKIDIIYLELATAQESNNM